MKFTYTWLQEHLETTLTPFELGQKLTSLGLEIEKIENLSESLKDFTIAEILEALPHPNADKLRVCSVKIKEGDIRQVVCGAPNARKGLKVVFAAPGVFVPGAGFTIKESTIRGEKSAGMLCSYRELSLEEDGDGIIELPSDAPVGGSFVQFMKLDDPLLEVGLTPNRGDCLSVRGIARDLAAAGYGVLKPLLAPSLNPSFRSNIDVIFHEDVKAAATVSHFVGYYIKGVKNGPSPLWLQKKLEAVGITPISALVDVTNYISHDVGRPLHVFDAAKLQGDLKVRFAQKGETIKTLDHKEHTLDHTMMVVADDKGPTAIAGIIGSEDSSCTLETTDVFLEAAYFNKISVSMTGRALGIITDARHRAERGIDPEGTEIGAQKAAAMIVDLCGGVPSHPVIAGRKAHNIHEVTLREGRIFKKTGVSITLDKAADFLQKLGCSVVSHTKDILTVTTPSFRHDLVREEDLIEEVVRLFGYDNIPQTTLPRLKEQSPLSENEQMRHKVRYLLAERGLNEVLTWSMVDEKAAQVFGPISHALKINNPISQDLMYMRPSVLPTLLTALQKGWDYGAREFAFFETGPTYHGNKPGDQKLVAAGVRLGNKAPLSWNEKTRDVDVYDVKGDALAILGLYGLTPEKYQLDTSALPDWYHPGRAVAIKQGPKRILGFFGEIHPRVLKAYGLKKRAVAFEINLSDLALPKQITYNKGPYVKQKLQPVERDFAFLADKETPAALIVDVIKRVHPKLISEAYVFDTFEGEGIGLTKKSLSVHVVIQPQEATLRDLEIKEIYDNIIAAVQEKTGALLRL